MAWSDVELALLALRGLGALIGIAFFVIVVRAYRRTGARSMFVLGLATALLTIASLAEGAALRFLGADALDTAHLIESVLFLAAFSVLLWSVLSHRQVEEGEG